MPRWAINSSVFSDIGWWHWMLTIPCLCLDAYGYRGAMPIAIALGAVVFVVFYLHRGEVKAFPVQVRFAYLLLLLAGTLEGLRWVHTVQLIGTGMMVTIGYCPLARMLRMFPVNRDEPLTLSMVRRLLFVDRLEGGMLQFFDPDVGKVSPPSCSIKSRV